MSKPLVRVVIGIPNKGLTDALAYDNHLEFVAKLGKLQAQSAVNGSPVEFAFSLVTIARVFPALARERICEFGLDEGKADYMLQWDEDMILPMDMFERLYAHNVDIVAPLAFTRLAPHVPVIYHLESGWDAVEQKEYYINHAVRTYPHDRLVQVDAVGFGAVLIKRRVFDEMPKPWFMTTSGAGEDIHFCHKAGKLGFKVYVDTSVKLGHLTSPMVVTEETYESQPHIQELRQTQKVDEIKYTEVAG